MKTYRIELTRDEVEIATYIARRRKSRDRKRGIPFTPYGDAKGNPEREMEVEVNGFGAELAFCKMTNTYPDFNTKPRKGMITDCQYNEVCVDVKQTHRIKGNLLVPVKSTIKGLPDVYVLMIGKIPTFRYTGWQTADEVIQEKWLNVDLEVPAYFYPRKRLIWKLWSS